VLRVASYAFRVTGYELRVPGCAFRVIRYGFRVTRSYKILIYEDEHEDEDEKNQITSHAYALRLFLFSAFRLPHSRASVICSLTPDTRNLILSDLQI
jgi:hypothetical protein